MTPESWDKFMEPKLVKAEQYEKDHEYPMRALCMCVRLSDLREVRAAMTEVDLGDDIIEEADKAHYQRRLAEALAASHEYAQLSRVKGNETEELTND
jgi:hypothetical protein